MKNQKPKIMSQSLVFQPVKPTKCAYLAYELKHIFTKKYYLDDGSYRMGNGSISYLEGLRDAGNKEIQKDIQRLINAIEKWGEVDIWLEG